MPSIHETTSVLLGLSEGDAACADRLMALIYEDLRALAESKLRKEHGNHSLQPTLLVHEVYLRLIDQTRVDWKGRTHFFAVAAMTLRRILVDYYRKHRNRYRVARDADPDEAAGGESSNADIDLEALDGALTELQALNERQARVVELRYFAGLGVEDTAAALGVSERTVKGDWHVARAWLQNRLRNT